MHIPFLLIWLNTVTSLEHVSRSKALCFDCPLFWEAYYIAVYESKGCCLLEEPENIFICQKYVAYISHVPSMSVSSGSLQFNISISSKPPDVILSTRWRSWLRHCVISRKVAGSIPDGVIGIVY